MVAPGAGLVAGAPSMLTLALIVPRPGVYRMTTMLSSDCYRPEWDAKTLATQLQFPGVSPQDFEVRTFDADNGIVEIDCIPAPNNPIMKRWLASMTVGTRTTLAPSGSGHLPNFASGRRVYIFADDSSVAAVHDILTRWPASACGTAWIDTPDPRVVADLPVVDGLGVVSFHLEMGFDPLVTAARRLELDSTTTVWAAGERHRMDDIRATCEAAGLTEDDTRVFGYWSDEGVGRRS